jgi:isopentenyl-diphosphate delta-isomerase
MTTNKPRMTTDPRTPLDRTWPINPMQPNPLQTDLDCPEMVVLVNERNRRTGVAAKLAVHHSETPLHRGFSCYLFDSDGQILVTQRSSNKRTFPGVWSNSVCGHPGPGERATAAVRRRLQFELGILAKDVTCILPEFRYRAEMDGIVEYEVCPVFTASTRETACPNHDEVDACVWMSWDDFCVRLRATPAQFSPWCLEQVDQLTRINFVPPILE